MKYVRVSKSTLLYAIKIKIANTSRYKIEYGPKTYYNSNISTILCINLS